MVIGDTPRDIACARVDGVRVIAVATGPFPAEALADADAVVDGVRAALPVLADFATGLTTCAEPPPRRVGSAAASSRRRRRNSIPVAAPISPLIGGVSDGRHERVPEVRAERLPAGEAMNAGSACVVGAVALGRARRGDRLRQRLAEVEAARAGSAARS